MTEIINPLGLPQVLIIIAILAFALWKTAYIRLLLSICLIIWGIFAVPYDDKIGIPVAIIGFALFTFALLKVWRGTDYTNETIER